MKKKLENLLIAMARPLECLLSACFRETIGLRDVLQWLERNQEEPSGTRRNQEFLNFYGRIMY